MNDWKTRFREQFINDHNKGEERFLRGLFIEEFEQFIEAEIRKAKEEERNKTIKEIYAMGTVDSEVYDPQRSLKYLYYLRSKLK